MAQDDSTQATTGLNIPQEVEKKFPEYVKLIKVSQSMNDEERQYWIDVLPIMTDDQLENLKSILDNEQKQLEEVDTEYQEGMQQEEHYFNLKFDEEKYREEKQMRVKAEKEYEMKEKKEEEEVLEEIASL